jgi:urea transport system substrate-binding protein
VIKKHYVVPVLAVAVLAVMTLALRTRAPIRIGVLHSLTGTMAISEKSVVDAVTLAVEEINRSGGLLGRQIEMVVADGQSNNEIFAREAERLIATEKVDVVFGCWTSGSRKTVRPVFEKRDHLLFYPVQYEGLESSPNIVYMGAAPNQQIIPAVRWAVRTKGRRFFLVGSDYVFPRAANAIIRDHLGPWRGQVVGEEYVRLGERDMSGVIKAIVAAKPEVILNTLNGDSNVAFFDALRAAGITAAAVPTISFSIAENELQSLPREKMAGDYAAWNYFQSIDTAINQQFVQAFKARYGAGRATSDPLEAAYVGVHLWAAAVTSAGTTDVKKVRAAVANRSQRGPGGMVYVDPENRHTWKTVRIGQIRPDGQFDIVWSSEYPIRPVPYPPQRTVQAWEAMLQQLYASWGNRWVRP